MNFNKDSELYQELCDEWEEIYWEYYYQENAILYGVEFKTTEDYEKMVGDCERFLCEVDKRISGSDFLDDVSINGCNFLIKYKNEYFVQFYWDLAETCSRTIDYRMRDLQPTENTLQNDDKPVVEPNFKDLIKQVQEDPKSLFIEFEYGTCDVDVRFTPIKEEVLAKEILEKGKMVVKLKFGKVVS